jgi:hypothetical protein
MNIKEVCQYITDSEMDLDELILERLGLSHEDIVAELISHIEDNIDNFQDLERHN